MTERDKERGDGRDPLDEEAAWAQIVAGYGETPRAPGDTPDPPGETAQEDDRREDGEDERQHGRREDDRAGPVPGVWHPDAVPDHGSGGSGGRGSTGDRAGDAGEGDGPVGSGPGAGEGDGDARTALPGDGAAAGDGSGTALPGEVNRLDAAGQWEGPGPRDWAPEEEEGEGRFVPPEPPPLPETDMITRFAWLGVIGGPVLLVGCAVLGVDMTWWLTTAGVGGFLGGMATLVLGMRDDPDDEWTDPGSGAVV